MSVQTINLEALAAAPVTHDPFPYLIVPGFVKAEAMADIEADYPEVELPGSLPLPSLRYGPRFRRFMEEICGLEMTSILGNKFNIDLSRHPTMITVRGQCRPSDGQIHT